MRLCRLWHGWGLLILLSSPAVQAEVAVCRLFADHMVLQRDMPLPVWGRAAPGESVTVSLGDRTAKTNADAGGHWRVRLDPVPAGGPLTLTVSGTNTLVIRDVLVGEVWVCSGQSNMQMDVKLCKDAPREIAAADYPRIRQFEVPRRRADKPKEDFPIGQWDTCSPATVGEFSGVAYYFGREMYRKLKVPIGLINTAWGGTPVESWIPAGPIENDPEFKPVYDRWQRQIDEYLAKPEAERHRPPSTQPIKFPDDPRLNQNRPSALYNQMLHPVIPYAIRGALWYQGESNVPRAYQYRKLFSILIQSWRSQWQQGDFPFLFVQLSNYGVSQKHPYESALAELREAQMMALSLPNTAMVVAADVGDGKDCHPLNKQEIGRRLFLTARALAYSEKLVYSGPLYDSMAVEGDRIRIKFKHAGEGLECKGGGPLKGFAIAGEDRRFTEADARIEGETVLVHCDKTSRPVAVRYNWADAPDGNLYNKTGLPAAPFRTDDWPCVTVNEK